MPRKKRKKNKKTSFSLTISRKNKKAPFILTILITLGIVAVCAIYFLMFSPNVKKDGLIYIPTGSRFSDVQTILINEGYLTAASTFGVYSHIKKYPDNIKPGCYKLQRRMNNRRLVGILIAGLQTPVEVKFNNTKTIYQLAGKIDKQLEIDSADIIAAIINKDFLTKNQLNTNTVASIFIPNTYQLWWTTTAEDFAERMLTEYQAFWEDKQLQAKKHNLTPLQVSIIASIVEEETRKNDEKPNVASVYINRFRIGMPLQADPTIKFAVGDFSLRRILNKHLKTASPYNTYINKGLPPGPICMPSIASINSVLNANSTKYLYFCAKEDFSGYHNFASTYSEHLANARKYQRELNQRGIK